MAEGVDYSFDKADPAQLQAAGKTFVVRYVSDSSSSKNLTRAEVQNLQAHGLAVVVAYQTSRGFMISGADEGRHAATAGLAMATACGMPAGRPIYFALDTDPAGLSNADWLRVQAFCDGAAAVLGRDRVGVYGGVGAMERLLPGSARWGWQTRAWSVNDGVVQWSSKAHIRQFDLGPTGLGFAAFGGTIDLDRSITTDFGQWPFEEDILPALSDAEQRELLQLLRKLDARSVETFKDISGDGRLREAVFAARALVGAEGNEEIDNAVAAGVDARANFKTLVQGAIVDGLREASPDHPDRGDLRGPFKDLLREVIDEMDDGPD
jgi:glycoside hydrolase-like protein